MRTRYFMWFWVLGIASCLMALPAFSQDIMWVTSAESKLKTENSASSETITVLPVGTEMTVLAIEDRWYKVRSPSGEEGWMYRGRLSETPPQAEGEKGLGDALTGLGGSNITAQEADTSRSIRGLSRETEQYARKRGTPAQYKQALNQVLAMSVTQEQLEAFLQKGQIGEYAR